MFAALPKTIDLHCLVTINSSMLFLTGGLLDTTYFGESNYTYFFDVLNNKWISGPPLIYERYDHSCGVMNWFNSATGTTEKVVVVAGGTDKMGNALSSVQLLFMSNYNNWADGPSLPKEISGSRMVEFQDGVILVGGEGNDNQLYQLSSPDGPWTEMLQVLKEKRIYPVTFLVPDEIVDCY